MSDTPPRIDGLDWDDWNLQHITEHDLTRAEVEDAISSEATYYDSCKNRKAVTGPTDAGRMLTVIIGESPHQPHRYDVFSARPASRPERRDDQRQKGGMVP